MVDGSLAVRTDPDYPSLIAVSFRNPSALATVNKKPSFCGPPADMSQNLEPLSIFHIAQYRPPISRQTRKICKQVSIPGVV